MKKTHKKEPQDSFYRITLTGKQLMVVQDALEWFFRVQMGQFFDYSTEVAKNGYKYDKNDPENDEKFNAYIRRRNDSKAMMEAAYHIACPVPGPITEDMMAAEDMYAIIRHFRWNELPEPKSHVTTDARKPIILTDEPPIKVEKVIENAIGLREGDTVWYVDEEIIEKCHVKNIVRKNGVIDSFGVEFVDDFDEFYGTAIGSSIFLSEEDAIKAQKCMTQGD